MTVHAHLTRRALLTGLVAAFVPGCLDSGRTNESNPPPGSDPTFYVSATPVDREEVEATTGLVRAEELPLEVRRAVRIAVDREYEMDVVGTKLLEFVADHNYLQVDDGYYELDPDFPQEVLVLERVEGIAARRETALGPDPFVPGSEAEAAVTWAAGQGEYRSIRLPAVVRRGVREADHVALNHPNDDRPRVYAWRIEVDERGGPPYRLDAHPVDPVKAYGDVAVALADLPGGVRDEVRRAVEAGDISVEGNSAVRSELGEESFVRVDGEYYRLVVSRAH